MRSLHQIIREALDVAARTRSAWDTRTRCFILRQAREDGKEARFVQSHSRTPLLRACLRRRHVLLGVLVV